MATVPRLISGQVDEPGLHTGDRMTRKEFHRRYEKMPDNFRAELIGGVVYGGLPIEAATRHQPLAAWHSFLRLRRKYSRGRMRR
jgi:hypothetical protein